MLQNVNKAPLFDDFNLLALRVKLPNLADLCSRSEEVNMLQFWEKKKNDRVHGISSESFLTKHSNNVWNVILVFYNYQISHFHTIQLQWLKIRTPGQNQRARLA